MEIIKEFYGLKTSGDRLHDIFSYTMRKLVYLPSKEDNAVWMKDEVKNYSYLCVFVDDFIYCGFVWSRAQLQRAIAGRATVSFFRTGAEHGSSRNFTVSKIRECVRRRSVIHAPNA